MGEIDDLRAFVLKQLSVAATEIIGAFTKTVTSYEERISCLEKENEHCRSLATTTLPKTKVYVADHVTKHSAGNPSDDLDAETGKDADAVGPHAVDSETDCKTKETGLISSTEVGSFVTRDHFLKSVSTKNCPFCFRKVAATERHLTQKHYAAAVRFIEDGAVKFVVPCMCEDAPQHRSHWHCPICVKTISRRSSFEVHITRQHECSVLQPSYSAEKLLRHHDQKENTQRNLITSLAQELDIRVVDSYIQDLGEIGTKSNNQQHASTQVMKTLDGGFADLVDPANESQHTTENKNVSKTEELETTRDSSETVSPSRIKLVKRPSFPGNPGGKRATHRCKACGKIFHYMYTLKTHVHTHARDRVSVCGLCGKRLGYKEHLVQHLKNHNKKNKCEMCGKQFSSDSRLKRHKIFHQPKTMNTFS